MRTLIALSWIVGCGGTGTTLPMAQPDLAQSPVERGTYLVEHLDGCGDCHTPRGADGTPDRSRLLSGALFTDFVPDDPTQGALYAPNLTPHMTGLGGWSDAQIKHAFLDGVAKDGQGLFPLMPYATLHNMSGDDADAIVAYLRSLPPVDNQVPDPQPLPVQTELPVPTLDPSLIPQTTLAQGDPRRAQADHGRYLAGLLGACIDCHTPFVLGGVPLDTKHLFAGNRTFDAASDGLPVPPYPPTIFSSNLTPDANGLQGWTPEEIAATLKSGVDKLGSKLCGPMPWASFAGISDEDALAIGVYLSTLAPNSGGGPISLCTMP